MSDEPHYLHHRQRLRDRFEKSGAEGMHDYELLELLLTYAIPRMDVKPLAKRLIAAFGSLSGVLDADMNKLQRVRGVGPMTATLIRLVNQLYSTYLAENMKKGDVLSSPEAVLKFARVRLSGLKHEAFMVIFMNTKNEVIDYAMLQEGTVDNVAVYPRRIIERALARHASGLILVHNHPSGNPSPSKEDQMLTRDIATAAHTLDIRVLDHIIVGKDGYFSFVESGMMPGAEK